MANEVRLVMGKRAFYRFPINGKIPDAGQVAQGVQPHCAFEFGGAGQSRHIVDFDSAQTAVFEPAAVSKGKRRIDALINKKKRFQDRA